MEQLDLFTQRLLIDLWNEDAARHLEHYLKNWGHQSEITTYSLPHTLEV